MTDPIGEALRFDPLVDAERKTGQSYKDDPTTMALGFLSAMDHNERKAQLLKDANDSYFGISFDDLIALYIDMGFAEVLRDPFMGKYDSEEQFVALWHTDGILATLESFTWEHEKDKPLNLNTSHVYYNIRFNDNVENQWNLTSSGGMRDGVWCGYADAREGVRYHIDNLRANGEFVSPWVDDPMVSFRSYMDYDTSDRGEAVAKARIAKLPPEVQSAIVTRYGL